MKKYVFFLSFSLLLLIGFDAYAQQGFKGVQQDQQHRIEKAYQRHKVSRLEYNKLMHEQDLIKIAIRKYEADGYWDPHEKKVVEGKLNRAESRLKRYKTNWEK